MSINRYAARRDACEPGIVSALEAVGAKVWRLKEPCDLLIRFRGIWHLMEIKNPDVKRPRKDQEKQNEFIAMTGCPVVRTIREALEAIGVI